MEKSRSVRATIIYWATIYASPCQPTPPPKNATAPTHQLLEDAPEHEAHAWVKSLGARALPAGHALEQAAQEAVGARVPGLEQRPEQLGGDHLSRLMLIGS